MHVPIGKNRFFFVLMFQLIVYVFYENKKELSWIISIANEEDKRRSLGDGVPIVSLNNDNYRSVIVAKSDQSVDSESYYQINNNNTSSDFQLDNVIKSPKKQEQQQHRNETLEEEQEQKEEQIQRAIFNPPPPPAQSYYRNMTYTTYRQNRSSNIEHYNAWFENGKGNDRLKVNADRDGPILDFAIVGFPKCGTTTMMANLGQLAPMPDNRDVCTPVHQTVYYAYNNWPNQYNHASNEKHYRGTKCPQHVSNLQEYSQYLPQTKLIIGIRHPVLWFQSFWNMQALHDSKEVRGLSPYNLTTPCTRHSGDMCRSHCPHRQLFCLHRSRFHIALAQMGKTPMNTIHERNLLAPDDYDGGINIKNHNIRNPIFIYEQTELNEEYVWESLSYYLNYHHHTHDNSNNNTNNIIPHDRIRQAHPTKQVHRAKSKIIDICDEEYDQFRAQIMPYSYNMSQWICQYLIPAAIAANDTGNIMLSTSYTSEGPNRFCTHVVNKFQYDPCGTLVRNNQNGEYYRITTTTATNTSYNNKNNATVFQK